MRLSVAILAAALCAFSAGSLAADSVDIKEVKLQRLVRSYVVEHLKDPDSAQFRNQYGLCGEVNAKNAYGGYTGYMRFMAASKDLVVFDNGELMVPSEFQKAWDMSCYTSPTGARRR